MSRIVAGGCAARRVNPGLNALHRGGSVALPKIALVAQACGTLQPLRCKTSLNIKSTGEAGNTKKQPETNQQHQAHVATALFRTLDRNSAIVTVLLK
jgi:hypothetical protein